VWPEMSSRSASELPPTDGRLWLLMLSRVQNRVITGRRTVMVRTVWVQKVWNVEQWRQSTAHVDNSCSIRDIEHCLFIPTSGITTVILFIPRSLSDLEVCGILFKTGNAPPLQPMHLFGSILWAWMLSSPTVQASSGLIFLFRHSPNSL
jgi:hypothetical protein